MLRKATPTAITLATLMSLASAFAISATPAAAAIVVDPHPYPGGADPNRGIHNFATNTDTTVTGVLQNTSLLYDFNSTPVEDLTINGGGHATVAGADGAWHSLTMTPQDPLGAFNSIDFNLQIPTGAGARDLVIPNLVQFSINGAALPGFYNVGNGNNMFWIYGDAGEVFNSITWTGWFDSDLNSNTNPLAAAEFADIRQIDLSTIAAVPEPATWAMMILGFGLIGGTMRRRQRQSVRYGFA